MQNSLNVPQSSQSVLNPNPENSESYIKIIFLEYGSGIGISLVSLFILLILFGLYWTIEQEQKNLLAQRLKTQEQILELAHLNLESRLTFFQNWLFSLSRSKDLLKSESTQPPTASQILKSPLDSENDSNGGDFVEIPRENPKSEDTLERFLYRTVLKHDLISGVWVGNLKGDKRFSTLKPGEEFLSRGTFLNPDKLLKSGKDLLFHPVLFNEETYSYHLPIEVLLKDELFIPQGSLMITIKLDFVKEIAEKLKIGGDYLTLIDDDGTVLFSWNQKLLKMQANILDSELLLRRFFIPQKRKRPGELELSREAYQLKEIPQKMGRVAEKMAGFLPFDKNFGHLTGTDGGLSYLMVFKKLEGKSDGPLPGWGILVNNYSGFYKSLFWKGMLFHFGWAVFFLAGLLGFSRFFLNSPLF